MQALWLLPSLSMSLLWGVRSGQWFFALITTAVSVLPWLLKARLSPSNASVELVRNRAVINGKRLPRNYRLWLPQQRAAVVQHLKTKPSHEMPERMVAEARQTGFASAEGGFSAWFGLAQGQHLSRDLSRAGPHLFVVGPTGTGKSQFLRLLVQSLSAGFSRSQLQIAVLDFKGSALVRELNPNNLVLAADDLEPGAVRNFCDWLMGELTEREQRGKHSGLPSGRLLVVVDEAAAALRASSEVAAVLLAVASRGRSLGIHLVLASQGSSGIPRELLLNLRMRVAMAGTDTVDLVQLGGQAQKLTVTSEVAWLQGRLISQSEHDCDFVFPILPSRLTQLPLQP